MNNKKTYEKINEAEKSGEYNLAINLAFKNNLSETYINLLEKYSNIFSAAMVAEKNGLWKKAIQLYRKCGEKNEAGKLLDTIFFDKK